MKTNQNKLVQIALQAAIAHPLRFNRAVLVSGKAKGAVGTMAGCRRMSVKSR